MKRTRSFLQSAALLLCVLLLSGCRVPAPDASASAAPAPASSPANSGSASSSPDLSAPPSEADKLDALLQQMTLSEKVGQLFLIRPEELDPAQIDGVTLLTQTIADTLRDYPVGGVILFRKNITDEMQLISLLSGLQKASSLPMFLAVDEEGGLVARLGNHPAFDLPKYQSAAAVGSSGDPADALSMGETIGAYLYRYGFNLDFAPVADVNTNPDNPIIGTRAFSSDPTVAAQMARAMADGLQQQSIIPVFKHFPGHGDTAEDSHSGIAINQQTQAGMQTCEWLPYGSLTDRDCVMVGHIAVPDITGDLTPATMSYDVVTGVLRQQLGFDGVVITDALEMGAVTDTYSAGEAAVQAIQAGCDVLLCPAELSQAFQAVLSAVTDGTISQQRLDESVTRILTLKQAYGLLILD